MKRKLQHICSHVFKASQPKSSFKHSKLHNSIQYLHKNNQQNHNSQNAHYNESTTTQTFFKWKNQ